MAAKYIKGYNMPQGQTTVKEFMYQNITNKTAKKSPRSRRQLQNIKKWETMKRTEKSVIVTKAIINEENMNSYLLTYNIQRPDVSVMSNIQSIDRKATDSHTHTICRLATTDAVIAASKTCKRNDHINIQQ